MDSHYHPSRSTSSQREGASCPPPQQIVGVTPPPSGERENQKLDRRFKDVEDRIFLAEATLLDPRFKKQAFLSSSSYGKAKQSLNQKAAGVKISVPAREDSTAEQQNVQDAHLVVELLLLYHPLGHEMPTTSQPTSSRVEYNHCHLHRETSRQKHRSELDTESNQRDKPAGAVALTMDGRNLEREQSSRQQVTGRLWRNSRNLSPQPTSTSSFPDSSPQRGPLCQKVVIQHYSAKGVRHILRQRCQSQRKCAKYDICVAQVTQSTYQ
ncbi:hypothetical protein C0J52_23534 [Blattella germanica]|nr:hypothetical protein C0J52_23534 [Blattella germanica]